MTSVGRWTFSISHATAAVVPVPVAPRSTAALSPRWMRRSSSPIACGWSPDGVMSVTPSKGATLRCRSVTGRTMFLRWVGEGGEFTLGQIRRLDAGSWFSPRFRGERVPTLAETLRAMEGSDMKLLLEIKNPGLTGRVADELRAQPDWLLPGRTIVQSFDWPSMEAFHRLLPRVPTAVIGTPPGGRLPAVARYAGYVNPRHDTVTAAYVRAVHARHMKVFAWVADNRATMRRLIDDRVDGIVSNRPEAVPRRP